MGIGTVLEQCRHCTRCRSVLLIGFPRPPRSDHTFSGRGLRTHRDWIRSPYRSSPMQRCITGFVLHCWRCTALQQEANHVVVTLFAGGKQWSMVFVLASPARHTSLSEVSTGPPSRDPLGARSCRVALPDNRDVQIGIGTFGQERSHDVLPSRVHRIHLDGIAFVSNTTLHSGQRATHERSRGSGANWTVGQGAMVQEHADNGCFATDHSGVQRREATYQPSRTYIRCTVTPAHQAKFTRRHLPMHA